MWEGSTRGWIFSINIEGFYFIQMIEGGAHPRPRLGGRDVGPLLLGLRGGAHEDHRAGAGEIHQGQCQYH